MTSLEKILLKYTTFKTVAQLKKEKETKYIRVSTALDAMKEIRDLTITSK
jgi:hypothetical protein